MRECWNTRENSTPWFPSPYSASPESLSWCHGSSTENAVNDDDGRGQPGVDTGGLHWAKKAQKACPARATWAGFSMIPTPLWFTGLHIKAQLNYAALHGCDDQFKKGVNHHFLSFSHRLFSILQLMVGVKEMTRLPGGGCVFVWPVFTFVQIHFQPEHLARDIITFFW